MVGSPDKKTDHQSNVDLTSKGGGCKQHSDVAKAGYLAHQYTNFGWLMDDATVGSTQSSSKVYQNQYWSVLLTSSDIDARN